MTGLYIPLAIFGGVLLAFRLIKFAYVVRMLRKWQPAKSDWVEDDLSRLNAKQRRRFDEVVKALQAAGFEPVHRARNGSITMVKGMVYTLVECRSKTDPTMTAFGVVLGFSAMGREVLSHSFEIAAKVARGGSVSCTSMQGSRDQSTQESKVLRYERIRDPAVLADVLRRLLPRFGGAKPADPPSIRRLNEIHDKWVRELQAAGKIELTPDGTQFRFTWGRSLSGWTLLVPGVEWFASRRAREESERWLVESGVDAEVLKRVERFRLPSELEVEPAR
ncbi:MAG: hypothetical protein HEQ23_09910 [Tepidisphaera sp.]